MNWENLDLALDPGTKTEYRDIILDASRNILDYFKVVAQSLQSGETVTNIDLNLNQD